MHFTACDELEFTTLNQMHLEDGLSAMTLDRGYAWLDTGMMGSLYEASEFVRTVEFSQELPVSAPGEIAFENSWIDKVDLFFMQLFVTAGVCAAGTWGSRLRYRREELHED